MRKDNILFTIVGILVGLMVGFWLTNSYNRRVLVSEIQEQKMPAMTQQNPGAAVPQVAEALEKAEKEPENFEAQINAANMFARINNLEKALPYFEKAIQIKPDDYQTLVLLGNINFETGKFADAKKWFEKASQIKPDDYLTIVALGNVNFELNDFGESRKWYEKALAKKNDDVNVRSDYGLTFFLGEPKDIDRAIKEYQTSLSINPNHEQTLQNLAVAYSEKRDIEGVRNTIARLEKVNPNNKIIQKLKE